MVATTSFAHFTHTIPTSLHANPVLTLPIRHSPLLPSRPTSTHALPEAADAQSWSIRPAGGVSSGTGYEEAYGHLPGRRNLPSKDVGPDWALLNEAAADIARYKAKASSRQQQQRQDRRRKKWLKQLKDLPGWLLYRYYIWRQDGVSDLLLVTGASTSMLLTAALIKRSIIDPIHAAADIAAAAADASAAVGAAAAGAARAASSSSGSTGAAGLQQWLAALWTDVYQVMVLSFGENFPYPDDPGSSPVEQVFSVFVALAGLAGFALALALVEQVVLETNLANVKRGSPVYEAGHYLVLGWAVSQRDLEVLIKLVGQLCSSAAADGGTTIVVLTQREKLEMEELFSRLVFRQGSPLLPSDLSDVAASKARATIIVSDQSRGRDEADAQSLRCAILLDELDDYKGLRKGRALGHIVVETRTANAVPLLRFSCSKRVIAMPTGQLNADRVARMLKRPFISWVSQRLLAFDSKSGLYMQPAPELVGSRFRSLPFLFPDAIVLGVAHLARGEVTLNPLLDYTLAPDDELVLCRPTAIPSDAFEHLPKLLSIPELERLGQQQLQQQQEQQAGRGWVKQLQQLSSGWQQQQQAGQQQLVAATAAVGGGSAATIPDYVGAETETTVATMASRQQLLETTKSSSSNGSSAGGSSTSSNNSSSMPGSSKNRPLPFAAALLDSSPGSSLQLGSPGSSLTDDLDPLNTTASQQRQQHRAAIVSSAGGMTAASLQGAAAIATADDEEEQLNKISSSRLSSLTQTSKARGGSSSLSKVITGSASSSCVAYNSAILSSSEEIDIPSTSGASSSSSSSRAPSKAKVAAVLESLEDDMPGCAAGKAPLAVVNDKDSIVVDEDYGEGYVGVCYRGEDYPDPAAGGVAVSSSGYDVAGWSRLSSALGSTMDSLDGSAGSGSSMEVQRRTQRSLAQQAAEAERGRSSSSSSRAEAQRQQWQLAAVHTGSSSSRDGSTDSRDGSRDGSRDSSGPASAWQGLRSSESSIDTVEPAAAASAVAAAAVSSLPVQERDGLNEQSSFNYVPREYLAADSSPQSVLVCGWSEGGFMAELLWAFDHSGSCLPPGSEIVFVNNHPPEDTLGVLLKGKTLSNVKVSHVLADPLQRSQLSGLPLSRFRAAVVLADERWTDPDLDDSNGIDSIDQPSVLRLDSLMVMVQLNIRKLLDDLSLPPINIICQKVATQGLTRFEDRRRLPLGISVNFNSMAAKLLTQVAVNPLSLLVITGLGGCADLTIVDASEYCARGEAISFWRVLSRVQAAGDVLMGYYVLPSHIDQPIESTINPQGLATRSKHRVWNTGDGRLKFMIIRDKQCASYQVG